MSSLPKNMGEADRTTNVGSAVLRPFNYYHNNNFKPLLEDMTEDYVEEGNIKLLLTDYSKWLSNPVVPIFSMKTFIVTRITSSIQTL